MIPAATYRLQLRGGIGLAEAAALVPHLERLGIGALYLSPIWTAVPGSRHGYDVIDPTTVDPALGGERGLLRLARTLRTRDMGLVLDIVPNHMAAVPANPWWRDVLLHGPGSRYAAFFDIDWAKESRVVLPILDGSPRIEATPDGIAAVAGGQRLPVRPGSADPATVAAATSGSADAVERVLAAQCYRLTPWRTGGRGVNYRRFFDVNGLAAVQVQRPEVFAAVHAGIARLAAAGVCTGIRVDHVDGLWDPGEYLRRLAAALPPQFPIWVEKILAPGEELPPDWPCVGTTGYDFLAAVSALLVDVADLPAPPFDELVRKAKREVLAGPLAPDVDRLLRQMGERTADIRRALVELTAWLPVYRTYEDDGRLEAALAGARSALPAGGRPALARVAAAVRGGGTAAARRWQQLTGPAMAKGCEDRALYRYARLAALNEVGGDPASRGLTVDAFHRWCAGRRRRWPEALSATSTHDTKRSEDVRARIAVLPELPSRNDLARLRPGEDPALEDLLLQSLLGAWPLQAGDLPAFAERYRAYVRKAAREAGVRTSWLRPDPAYEERLIRSFDALITGPEPLLPLQRLLAFYGAINSLAQVVLKVASPGVPDVYQGCEMWDLSLVDPDNRRPVDFAARTAALRALDDAEPGDLLRAWPDGRVKLLVTARALRFRRAYAALFAAGEYVPVAVRGAHAEHACAFLRHRGADWALTVVPRWPARLAGADHTGEMVAPLGAVWGDTALDLPAGVPAAWRNVITGEVTGATTVAGLLRELPVALMAAYTGSSRGPQVPVRPQGMRTGWGAP